MKFTYVCSGWEGSAADALVYHDARCVDFRIPKGKFYLADAGFGLSEELLIPYRGVRYHLAEWKRASNRYVCCVLIDYCSYPCSRPNTKEELFNLRHSSAWNVIERIFGVLKRRFRILLLPPEYSMSVQSLVPPALCALHNFIRRYDPEDINTFDVNVDDLLHGHTLEEALGQLAQGAVSREARARAVKMRDEIAMAMWDQYKDTLAD